MDKKYIQETGKADIWSEIENHEKIGTTAIPEQPMTNRKQKFPTEQDEDIKNNLDPS